MAEWERAWKLAVLVLFVALMFQLLEPSFDNFLNDENSLSLQSHLDLYLRRRRDILKVEFKMLFGHDLEMSDPREIAVNKILMDFKTQEYAKAMNRTESVYFPGQFSFFDIKKYIESTDVFKIIRMLPKGGALHMHHSLVATSEYFTSNLQSRHRSNLWHCSLSGKSSQTSLFRYFPRQPSHFGYHNCISATANETADKFDQILQEELSPLNTFGESTFDSWQNFEKKVKARSGIVYYEPIFRDYYFHTLQELYNDNVFYVEMRSTLTQVYHLNQTELSSAAVLNLLHSLTKQFSIKHPDFIGAKYIYAPHRIRSVDDISNMIDIAFQMKDLFPDFFAGFDVVGAEDNGHTLQHFLRVFMNASLHGMKFFFHAGETAWRGTEVDENLVDAILLNSARIGHAFALSKHPYLRSIVKQKKICVELCPIVNHILKLVDDFRNHPASSLLERDFPVVVSGDAPGIWGATPLSHDWYIAFMAMAGAKADLRFLKKLALNSIEFSAMSRDEKRAAFYLWSRKWREFLRNVLTMYRRQ